MANKKYKVLVPFCTNLGNDIPFAPLLNTTFTVEETNFGAKLEAGKLTVTDNTKILESLVENGNLEVIEEKKEDYTLEELEAMTLAELKKLATELGVEVAKTKKALIKNILER
ncbi:MAG: hypothetical protein ACRC28_18775 [Clostridium sp.]|uniref:hypothetical protein n=1 Tax=Clostridium sp. TaxID=1506 RepID=UPI003F37DAED